MSSDSVASEAERILRICSACMYCDGLCPVFPPLSGKHVCTPADLGYLANLCHNCRGCWYACQYAPPHPFAVNVPAALAGLRRQSYADCVWPNWLGRAFLRPALGAALMVLAALAAMLALVAATGAPFALGNLHPGPGSFCAIVPWALMAGLAGGSALWALVCVSVSTYRFWRVIAPDVPFRVVWLGLGPALRDVITLRRLDGGGPGCNDSGPRFSRRRRVFHHVMAAGIVLDFSATVAAFFDRDVFGLIPPYPLVSFPVCAGVAGGLAIVIGAAGLLDLEARADRAPADRGEAALNVVFLIALGFVALSGLALVALRETPALGPLLVVHIGAVFGLFMGLPAAKSLHAPYRAAALLRSAAEQGRSRAREGTRGVPLASD
jgi:citrate/tricarballylate utilization protein